jgi:hypothetical protein
LVEVQQPAPIFRIERFNTLKTMREQKAKEKEKKKEVCVAKPKTPKQALNADVEAEFMR